MLHKSPKTIYSDNNPEISGVIKLWSAQFWCNGSEWYGGQRRFELNYVLRDWRPFGKQSISYFICVRLLTPDMRLVTTIDIPPPHSPLHII